MHWFRFVGFSILVHGALIGFASQCKHLQRPLGIGAIHTSDERAWSGGWVAVTTLSPGTLAEPPEATAGAASAAEPKLSSSPSQRAAEAPTGTAPPRPRAPVKVAAPKAAAAKVAPATSVGVARAAARDATATGDERGGRQKVAPVASGGDWMSVERQLPAADSPPSVASRPASRRDPWVQRLMEAERRKAAREPTEQRAPAPALAPPKASPSPPQVARSASEAPREAAADAAERAAPRVDNAGLPRDLLYAFTFALPRAVESSSLWDELALGPLGRVRLRVRLERGRVTTSRLLSPPHPAARLVHDKTISLLRRGRFALGQRGDRSGSVVVQIDLNLSQEPSRSAVTLWNQLPERTSAHFIKPSGRRLDAHVEMFE